MRDTTDHDGIKNNAIQQMRQELAEKIAGEIALSAEPGHTIRKWRESFSISQQQLAAHLKISPSIISDYESGRRKSPGITTVRRLVNALLSLDEQKGGMVMKRYTYLQPTEAIISIRELPVGISGETLLQTIKARVVACPDRAAKKVYGYTVIDSVKAITSLSAFDYLKVYGWSSERALIFTGVKYGRSPMVAIRAHPMKPGMVVFHQPEKVDDLAVRLAEIESIPLAVTDLPQEEMVRKLGELGG